MRAVLVLFALMVLPLVASQRVTDYIVAARCQAKCITKYLPESPSDAACEAMEECVSCWQVCETLIHPDQPVPCDDMDCSEGCLTACHLMYTSPKAESAPDQGLWSFPSNPTVTVENPERLVVDWSPVRRSHNLRGVHPVYLLVWSDSSNPHWDPVYTTTEKWAEIEGPHYQYSGLVFNLLAITENGVVAEALPAFPPDGPHSQSHSSLGESNQPEIGVQVSIKEDKVQALVQWKTEATLPRIDVRWGRISCRVDQSLPECDIEDPLSHTQVEVNTQETSYLLTELTYNSRYWVEVTVATGETLREYFYTPWCHNPEPELTRCREAPITFRSAHSTISELPAGHAVPIYAVIAVCIALSLLLALTLWCVIRRQRALTLLSAKTRFIREGASSLRSSLSGSVRRLSPRLKASFRRFSYVKRGGQRGSTHSATSTHKGYSGVAQGILTRAASTSSDGSSKRNPYLDDLPSPPVPPRYTNCNTFPSFSIPSLDHDAEIYVDIEDAIPEYIVCQMSDDEDSGAESKMSASMPDVAHDNGAESKMSASMPDFALDERVEFKMSASMPDIAHDEGVESKMSVSMSDIAHDDREDRSMERFKLYHTLSAPL